MIQEKNHRETEEQRAVFYCAINLGGQLLGQGTVKPHSNVLRTKRNIDTFNHSSVPLFLCFSVVNDIWN